MTYREVEDRNFLSSDRRPVDPVNADVGLFDGLVAEASSLGVLSRQTGKGDQIPHGEMLTLILSGSVALLSPGTRRLAMTAGPGDVLGVEALADVRSPLGGVWLTPGRVLLIKARQLIDDDDPSRHRRWIGEASSRMQRALAREITCCASHAVTLRLANLISRLSGNRHTATITVNQGELADLLGVQRTSVNAAMSELKRLGAARTTRGRIQVIDAARLRAVGCGCGARRSFVGQEPYSPVEAQSDTHSAFL